MAGSCALDHGFEHVLAACCKFFQLSNQLWSPRKTGFSLPFEALGDDRIYSLVKRCQLC